MVAMVVIETTKLEAENVSRVIEFFGLQSEFMAVFGVEYNNTRINEIDWMPADVVYDVLDASEERFVLEYGELGRESRYTIILIED